MLHKKPHFVFLSGRNASGDTFGYVGPLPSSIESSTFRFDLCVLPVIVVFFGGVNVLLLFLGLELKRNVFEKQSEDGIG